MSKIRLVTLGLIAFLPSFLKRSCYRLFFGYKIGKSVKIGLTLLDAKDCTIDDDVTIGHLNVFIGVKKLSIGDHTKIGHLNIFRGGDEIKLGRYTEIIRLNEINAIPNPIAVNEVDSRFLLGDGSVIAASHKIDFTDRVEFGKCVILGGRNSSLWTHNRQMTKPIIIGDYSYIGSEIRMVPGSEIPAKCIVGVGSVITKKLEGEYNLIGGMPAKIIRELDDDGKFLTGNKTRPDLPDDI
jgi:acetyltransferase-like isoleucine patch superfamily enzyme